AHRQRAGTYKALPSRSQHQALDRTTDRIRPIEYPYCFFMRRRRFEYVAERGDEGVDPAAQVLQIDDNYVACIDHLICWSAHLTIQAKTGMVCTGSLKCGDSIMLSCLSPRSPCCGPNAAAILTSPQAASASSECAKSAVTEAGCASKATRLPLSGRRKARSVVNRSMPNFMVTTTSNDLKRKTIRMVKIRLAGRMSQCPIRPLTVRFLDHCREPQP